MIIIKKIKKIDIDLADKINNFSDVLLIIEKYHFFYYEKFTNLDQQLDVLKELSNTQSLLWSSAVITACHFHIKLSATSINSKDEELVSKAKEYYNDYKNKFIALFKNLSPYPAEITYTQALIISTYIITIEGDYYQTLSTPLKNQLILASHHINKKNNFLIIKYFELYLSLLNFLFKFDSLTSQEKLKELKQYSYAFTDIFKHNLDYNNNKILNSPALILSAFYLIKKFFNILNIPAFNFEILLDNQHISTELLIAITQSNINNNFEFIHKILTTFLEYYNTHSYSFQKFIEKIDFLFNWIIILEEKNFLHFGKNKTEISRFKHNLLQQISNYIFYLLDFKTEQFFFHLKNYASALLALYNKCKSNMKFNTLLDEYFLSTLKEKIDFLNKAVSNYHKIFLDDNNTSLKILGELAWIEFFDLATDNFSDYTHCQVDLKNSLTKKNYFILYISSLSFYSFFGFIYYAGQLLFFASLYK